MERQIEINFKNVVNELNEKKLRLCFIKDRSIFIEDSNKNLYQIELYYYGSYLDKLIKTESIVKFNLIEKSGEHNIYETKKEYWNSEKVQQFIHRWM